MDCDAKHHACGIVALMVAEAVEYDALSLTKTEASSDRWGIPYEVR